MSSMPFHEIVRVFQQPLYWYIRRVVLVHEDAEDILQETFIKAYKHLWMLRNEKALKSWLFRIATNETNRYFRKCKGYVALENFSGLEITEEEGVAEDKVLEIVSSAILKMTPLQRQVFSLRYYNDMNYDEISKITGSSKNSLTVSYHEAKKIIEEEINK